MPFDTPAHLGAHLSSAHRRAHIRRPLSSLQARALVQDWGLESGRLEDFVQSGYVNRLLVAEVEKMRSASGVDAERPREMRAVLSFLHSRRSLVGFVHYQFLGKLRQGVVAVKVPAYVG